MNNIEFKVNDYRSMSDAQFKSIIKRLSMQELYNRIEQANKKSNVYTWLTEEVARRIHPDIAFGIDNREALESYIARNTKGKK